MFSFAMIEADNAECLGVVAFARPDFKPGDVIPQGEGRSLRVVNVLESEREDRLPVLVVELAEYPSLDCRSPRVVLAGHVVPSNDRTVRGLDDAGSLTSS